MPLKTPKPLPTVSQDLPPVSPTKYGYFAPADQRMPFEAAPVGSISWTNAWWLADFSLLSYCDRDDIKVGLAASGFGMREDHFISIESSQGFVASNEDAIVVVFRGTELPHFHVHAAFDFVSTVFESAADWWADAGIKRVPFADAANRPLGEVHSGFLKAFGYVRDQIDAAVATLVAEKPRPIWYTGHSLGGAMATLAAAYFGNAAGLYTYGCPRVGDDQFAQVFPGHTSVWRFCVPGDPVALVPPRGGWMARTLSGSAYRHLGKAIWIDEHASPVQSDEGYEPLAIPNPRKHAPMRYSNLIWNYLASVGA